MHRYDWILPVPPATLSSKPVHSTMIVVSHARIVDSDTVLRTKFCDALDSMVPMGPGRRCVGGDFAVVHGVRGAMYERTFWSARFPGAV